MGPAIDGSCCAIEAHPLAPITRTDQLLAVELGLKRLPSQTRTFDRVINPLEVQSGLAPCAVRI
jgi:hypothetical protein